MNSVAQFIVEMTWGLTMGLLMSAGVVVAIAAARPCRAAELNHGTIFLHRLEALSRSYARLCARFAQLRPGHLEPQCGEKFFKPKTVVQVVQGSSDQRPP